MPTPPLVMIVDEDEIFRQELAAVVTPARMVVVADSGYGVQAVSLAEERRPDVILAAVEEPVVRAIDTIRSLRQVLPGSPVIAYSGNPDLALARQAMQAGACDLLPHPIRAGELLASIERAIGPKFGGDSLAAAGAVQPRPAGTVITVAGAKGGIGKSTIVSNLAAAIARNTDKSVLAVDMDTRFGDVAVMLDVQPKLTAIEAARSIRTLDRDEFRDSLVRHSSGAYVLPSPKHPEDGEPMERDAVTALLAFAARIFDYVLVDTPGAWDESVKAAIEASNQVLLVTSVDIASIKDTSFVLDMLDGRVEEERLLLVLNHPNGANTIRAEDVQRVLHHTIDWNVPHDDELTIASQTGMPVVMAKPRTAAARSLLGLSERLTGRARTTKQPGRSIFRRLIASGS